MTPVLPAEPTRFLEICPNPIFIIGSPRSGTTILAMSLAQHSDLWASAESDFLFYLFGNAHAESAFDRTHRRPNLGWLQVQGVERSEFLRYVGLGLNALFTSRSAGRRWIDQTPLYTIMVDTLAEMFPEAVFLHILRDGRKVVHSMINFLSALTDRADVRREKLSDKVIGSWTTDFKEACRTWARYSDIASRFCERHPNRCWTVVNERLAADPATGFREICGFLGVAYEERVAEFFRTNRINSSFRSTDSRERGRPRPDPWTAWDAEQRRVFVEEAGPAMVRYGLATADDLELDEYVRLQRIVASVVPRDSTVMVISKGDDALLDLPDHRAWHFPQDRAGLYAGYHPADSAEAITHLEQLRGRGGQFLVIPQSSCWWLDHYSGFREHLDVCHRKVWADASCIIYQLTDSMLALAT